MPVRSPVSPRVEAEITKILRLAKLCQDDINFATDLYSPWLKRINVGQQVDLFEFGFYAKTLMRCLLGAVDAIGFMMRKAVVALNDVEGLGLTNKEVAKLRERIYDPETDSITERPSKFLATPESFKLGVQYFPHLFGQEMDFDFSGQGWQSLRAMNRARNDFTHPKKLHLLYGSQGVDHLQAAALWWFETTRRVFLIAQSSYNDEPAPARHSMKVRPSNLPDPATVFDKDFYIQIEESPSNRIAYLTAMFRELSADTSRAFDLLSNALKKINPAKFVKRNLYTDEGLQFAARNLLRTFSTQVEGTIETLRLILNAAQSNGEIALSGEDLEILNNNRLEVEDQLWEVVRIWSREFGFGATIDRDSKGWKDCIDARKWRNGVTHPTNLGSFLVPPANFNVVMGLPAWFSGYVLGATTLSQEKLETAWLRGERNT